MEAAIEVLDAQVHLFERGPPAGRADTTLSGLPADIRQRSIDHYARTRLTGEAFVGQMDAARVRRAIVVTSAVVYDDNAYPLECHRKWPERFRVVGIIDATKPDIEEILGGWRVHAGIVGVRISLLGAGRRAILERGGFDAFFRGARRAGLPVCLFAQDFADAMARLARRFSDLQFVVDHLGIHVDPLAPSTAPLDALPRICKLLSPLPNITMKLGNLPSLSDEQPPFADLWPRLAPLLDSFGTERVMWASDRTWYPAMPYETQVDVLRENHRLSRSDREWLLGSTASRVFGWPAAAK